MQLSACGVWLATAAVDTPTVIDGLSLHVQQALGRAHCDGTAYVCQPLPQALKAGVLGWHGRLAVTIAVEVRFCWLHASDQA
jgi:transposase